MIKKHYLMIIMVFFVLIFASNGISEPLTPKLSKAKVIAAVKLIEAEGDAAIAKIKDPNGEFRFGDGKGYLWLQDREGIMVMHPIKPTLDGKALFGIKDVNGRFLFAAFDEVVEDNGAGWVPYAWPKPGEDKSSAKISFVMLAKGGSKDYIVGAGMYDVVPADIKKGFPGDAIYED
ncbi:MAG: chemotaxis protein [Bacteroidetes bacterium]|nr:chemotaxis protein [Bacteroidota bacterium]